MGYKIPVEFIKNENGLINNNIFTMLLLILNHENFRSQNMKMEYRYLKNKMDISDNRTIKRVIANLVNLNIISDVEYSMKGEVTIGRIKNYSKDELFKIELELPIRDKHLTRFIFYITYYKYMHLNNFPYDYCMYLSRKNICSALDIEYKKLGSMLRELLVSSSYKEVIDFSEILKERTPLDERIEILEELEGTEEQRLEKYIVENIEEIEIGLVFIESQYKIKHGKIELTEMLIKGYEVESSLEEKLVKNFSDHKEIIKFYDGEKELDKCEIEQYNFSRVCYCI